MRFKIKVCDRKKRGWDEKNTSSLGIQISVCVVIGASEETLLRKANDSICMRTSSTRSRFKIELRTLTPSIDLYKKNTKHYSEFNRIEFDN